MATHLRRASRAMNQVYAASMAPAGLQPTQFSLLIACMVSGKMPISALAHVLVLDRTTLARNLKPLEKQHLVRIETGDDRRVRLVALSEKGRTALAGAMPLWVQAQERVTARFGQKRLNHLLGEVAKLVKRVQLMAGYGLFLAWPAFRQVVLRTRLSSLIGVQLYRILGGVFIAGYAQGQVPAVFALPAGLGDILIGLLAPVVATLVAVQHPWALRCALLWNLAGIADLVMAVTLGILSAPGHLQRLALDGLNSTISAFPFVLIPTVLVPISILLHLFSLHALGQIWPRSSKAHALSPL